MQNVENRATADGVSTFHVLSVENLENPPAAGVIFCVLHAGGAGSGRARPRTPGYAARAAYRARTRAPSGSNNGSRATSPGTERPKMSISTADPTPTSTGRYA
jgi:hypothetical protein